MSSEDMNTTHIGEDKAKEDSLVSSAPSTYGGSSEVGQETDLLAELRELGGNLLAAIQAIGQSEPVRNLQRDLSNGLRNAADQLGSTAQNVGESDVAKNVKEQATKVTANPVVRDVQTNIASALRELNQRISSWAESTRKSSQASSANASDPESVQLTLPGEVGDIVEPETNGHDKPTTKLND